MYFEPIACGQPTSAPHQILQPSILLNSGFECRVWYFLKTSRNYTPYHHHPQAEEKENSQGRSLSRLHNTNLHHYNYKQVQRQLVYPDSFLTFDAQ